MGRVYRAYDPKRSREVAIKTLKEPFASDARALERFRREAQVVGRLSHPALVRVYALGRGFIVQELVEGESLAARIAREGALPATEAVPVLRAVASALDHIHGHGIVHRDLKPANVLLSVHGGAKVTDFGVAHLASAPMTRTGEMIGSPAYMSPEQVERGEVDARSDLYTLGVLAFEALTGALPFHRRSLGALLESVVHDDAPPASVLNPALTPGVDAVLAAALAKEPDERFPSARAFVRALERALDPRSPLRVLLDFVMRRPARPS
jgi:serine/threonine-protein kinase